VVAVSLLRLYLLVLTFWWFIVVFEVLIAWPRDAVALPSEEAPSWAPGDTRPPQIVQDFQREFMLEQTHPRAQRYRV